MKRLLLGVNGEKNSLLRVIENILITENEYWTHFNTYVSLPIPIKKQYVVGIYKTAIKRLGYSFLTYVRNAVKSNRLLYGDAHALTGCHSDMFETLMYKNALN
jgi:hypothetical protein